MARVSPAAVSAAVLGLALALSLALSLAPVSAISPAAPASTDNAQYALLKALRLLLAMKRGAGADAVNAATVDLLTAVKETAAGAEVTPEASLPVQDTLQILDAVTAYKKSGLVTEDSFWSMVKKMAPKVIEIAPKVIATVQQHCKTTKCF